MKIRRIVSVSMLPFALAALLALEKPSRADRIDDYIDNPGPNLLKRDTNDRRDALDRVLAGGRNFPIEIEAAIRRGERTITGQRQVITNIQNEPPGNGPTHHPTNVWNDQRSYERIATSCNKSVVDEEHVPLTPPDDLCSRIFHGACYASLSDHNRDKIDHCPAVYDERGSKAWRIAQAEERITRIQDKIEQAKKLLPAAQTVDADSRAAKTVGALDDDTTLRRPGSVGRVRGIDSP